MMIPKILMALCALAACWLAVWAGYNAAESVASNKRWGGGFRVFFWMFAAQGIAAGVVAFGIGVIIGAMP